jgi:chaperonin GroES
LTSASGSDVGNSEGLHTFRLEDVIAATHTVTTLKFVPLADQVVVKPIQQQGATASGIILPDTTKERPREGQVVAVGPGRIHEDGKRVPMEVEVGDQIIYSKFAGTEYKVSDQEYLLLKESDVLAKITK